MLDNYRRSSALHFNQASRPGRLTGLQTRLTAIVPSMYTIEAAGINNARLYDIECAGPRVAFGNRSQRRGLNANRSDITARGVRSAAKVLFPRLWPER